MMKHRQKTCPKCERQRPKFVVKKAGCDVCRTEAARGNYVKKSAWTDIKAEAKRRLAETDWAVLADVVERGEITQEMQDEYKRYRKKIANIKNGPERESVEWPFKPE